MFVFSRSVHERLRFTSRELIIAAEDDTLLEFFFGATQDLKKKKSN